MDNIKKPAPFKLILLTPVFILLAHYLVVFIHEYAHAFTAWMLGYKSNPFDLNYGVLAALMHMFLSGLSLLMALWSTL